MVSCQDLLDKSYLFRSKGQYKEAIKLAVDAKECAEKSGDNAILSCALGTIGFLLNDAGANKEHALEYQLQALSIQEKLAQEQPFYYTWVATTQNNLGALLSDMGRQEDAKTSYERALKLYEALLAADPENTVYQSDVATTLNNLGNLLSDMGRQEDAKTSYERALEIREALYRLHSDYPIYQSKFASYFLRFWENELFLIDLDREYTVIEKYKEAIRQLEEKADYFEKLGLSYESYLTKNLLYNSKLKCCSKKASNLKNPEMKAKQYRACKDLITSFLELELDEEQKKKLSGLYECYEGRALINESLAGRIDRTKFEEAVKVFENASLHNDNAKQCHAIYSILLHVISLPEKEINLKDIMSLIEGSETHLKSEIPKQCFIKMKDICNKAQEGEDFTELMKEINDILFSIESRTVQEIMRIASGKLDNLLKYQIVVDSRSFHDWHLNIDISGINGHIKIFAGEKLLDEMEVSGKKNIRLPFEPENLQEFITIQDAVKPHLKRTVRVSCCEPIGDHDVYFVKRSVM